VKQKLRFEESIEFTPCSEQGFKFWITVCSTVNITLVANHDCFRSFYVLFWIRVKMQ
jgi:hypothetical protein